MIDAINEIKREESENKKKLKEKSAKKNKEHNELFSRKIKDEIKTFQKNICNTKIKILEGKDRC